MSSVEWQINGQPTAILGVSNLQRARVSLGVDRFSFSIPGRPLDSAFAYAYRAPVVVTRNGQQFFLGSIMRRQRAGSGSAEGHQYVVGGPWLDLENLVYQQAWTSGTWTGGVFSAGDPKWQSRVILGQEAGGGALTTGAMVQAIIQYAQSCGVAIAPGSIAAGVAFPWDEVCDVTCAEAILRVLRWTPGATSWIDYAQPVPTFNLVAGGHGAAVSVPALQCSSIVSAPREDGAVSSVVIHYDRLDILDGYPSRMRTTDAYPAESTGKAVGSLVTTIELAGGSVVTQIQRVLVDALPADAFAANNAWWLAHCEALQDPAIRELVITGEGRTGTLPNELVTGALQDWMRASIESATNSGVRVASHYHLYYLKDEVDVWTAKAVYKVPDPAKVGEWIEKTDRLTVTLTATDAVSRDYVKRDIVYGDSPVAGLAQDLYLSLQGSSTAGEIVLLEEECSGACKPSDLVTLIGIAQVLVGGCVQSVAEDLDRGATTITIGPPSHLSVCDFVALLRINRLRRPASRTVERVTGIMQGAGNVEIGSAVPKRILSQGQISGEWITVVTASRYDVETDQLQIKTREVRVVAAADESAWTMIAGGQAVDCPET